MAVKQCERLLSDVKATYAIGMWYSALDRALRTMQVSRDSGPASKRAKKVFDEAKLLALSIADEICARNAGYDSATKARALKRRNDAETMVWGA